MSNYKLKIFEFSKYNDQRMSYAKPANAVILFFTPNNEVLLLKNTYNDKKWGTVGGSIDLGETPYTAAVREGFEETGINFSDPEFVWESFFKWKNTVFFIVGGNYLSNIELSYEHSAYAYVHIGNVLEMNLTGPATKSFEVLLNSITL